MLLTRLLNLWPPFGKEAPTSEGLEGLEYTLPANRCHYVLLKNRVHYTLPVERAHYEIPGDD